MPSAYFFHPGDSGCLYHRSLCPARFCNDYFRPHGWEFFVGDSLPEGHDCYFLHGLPTPAALPEIGKIKRRGAKFVWSLDDDWNSIPDWNPANPGIVGMAVYECLKNLSDWILVSTPALAETFSDFTHKVVVAPNLLDLSNFPTPPRESDGNGGEYFNVRPIIPVRVVWIGGHTHSGDVEVMTDMLDKFLDKYGGEKAVVIYQGMAPHGRLVRKYLHRSLYHQPSVPFTSYQSVLNSIEPHVYLAPLAPIPFNESKSNLRIMESWALCAAPIATDWGEYKCIENGFDGRLVSDPDSWYSGLVRLVTDHELRLQMALRGRVRVEQRYNWNKEECRKPWYIALSKILGVES